MAGKEIDGKPAPGGVAAVSVGIVEGRALLDCATRRMWWRRGHEPGDDSAGEFIELQGSGEEAYFHRDATGGMIAAGKAASATC